MREVSAFVTLKGGHFASLYTSFSPVSLQSTCTENDNSHMLKCIQNESSLRSIRSSNFVVEQIIVCLFGPNRRLQAYLNEKVSSQLCTVSIINKCSQKSTGPEYVNVLTLPTNLVTISSSSNSDNALIVHPLTTSLQTITGFVRRLCNWSQCFKRINLWFQYSPENVG